MADHFKPNRHGIADILKEPALRDDLRKRGERVRDAANATGTELNYVVHDETGKNRVRVAVVTGNARTGAHEHAHHTLATAIDAARG